jgi:hypothetical protein
MRMRSHTVIFDNDPEFARYLADQSGSVMTIVRIWVAQANDPAVMRHYVGSVRHCQFGRWMSRLELRRLFRQATLIAEQSGEEAHAFRTRLSSFLRECVEQT